MLTIMTFYNFMSLEALNKFDIFISWKHCLGCQLAFPDGLWFHRVCTVLELYHQQEKNWNHASLDIPSHCQILSVQLAQVRWCVRASCIECGYDLRRSTTIKVLCLATSLSKVGGVYTFYQVSDAFYHTLYLQERDPALTEFKSVRWIITA